MDAREPCQVRNEAALSDVFHVPLLAWHIFHEGPILNERCLPVVEHQVCRLQENHASYGADLLTAFFAWNGMNCALLVFGGALCVSEVLPHS